MENFWLPVLFTLLAWWLSTGIVLILNRQANHVRSRVFIIATLLGIFCIYGLLKSSQQLSQVHTYLAFGYALTIWAWCEMSYFMGFITGTRKKPCPQGATNWQRFVLAIKTSIHHELLVIFLGLMIVYTTWNLPNKVGMWTFVILWLMRWSTKLNIFLGVSNLHKEWIPKRLEYIASYTKQKSINFLFPVSITIASFILAVIILAANSPTVTNIEVTAYTLVATLLALAILEHWFLLLPINDSFLWKWAMNAKKMTCSDKGLRVNDINQTADKKIYSQ